METLNQAIEIKPVHHSNEHDNSVQIVDFNPSNPDEFFSGSHDCTVKIWDLNTFKPITTLSGLE